MQSNCGQCQECRDMKCFGGPGVKKKACRKRKCINRGSSVTSKDHATNPGKVLVSVYHSAFYFIFLSACLDCDQSMSDSLPQVHTKKLSRDKLLQVIERAIWVAKTCRIRSAWPGIGRCRFYFGGRLAVL